MKNITAKELNNYLTNNKPLLLDVRENWEWDRCSIANSRLLPMGQIVAEIDNLDKNQETVIICHHGIRSMQVARYFDLIGFESIINLHGGIDAWAKQVDHKMTQY
jgi:rhodanese-related sulfurtransferase